MTTTPEFHRQAAMAFSGIVAGIDDDRWKAPTPCTEWDVRALLNHNVAENLWVPPLLDGATIEEIGDRFEGDVLGEDPQKAWEASVWPACEAIEQPGAETRLVHLSFGDTPAEEFCRQRTFDLVVHSWDLARGAGLPDTIDEELAAVCYEWTKVWEPMLAPSGLFAPAIEPAPDADVQTRLLNLVGRKA